MSLFKHHEYRKSIGISNRDEFVLGILYEFGEVKSSFLDVHNLLHKKDIIKRLKDRGLINVRLDKNRNMLSLSELGVAYIQQIKEFYVI